MNTTTQPSQQSFAGAWLTDIDDTLIPSGKKPDDEWIAALADFVRVLKQNNILWAPVSGVAIAKMGDRLLYRLPEDVLSHVMYYGGEGSTKSRFNPENNSWFNEESFQRNFSDAQALALVGKERFIQALAFSEHDDDIAVRIAEAEGMLEEKNFAEPCLIDAMETELEAQGLDKGKAETYYRGGAISWMMLGDHSVEIYKGKKQTQIRLGVRDFAQEWLDNHNYLRKLGESGVKMPYKHATRGIKMVLEGNDKGRAADDLIKSYGIPAQSILFMGNELFDGGNDNSVRRVAGVHLVSVGEVEDNGVVDGGVQVGANKYWMDGIVDGLNQGTPWNELLRNIPEKANCIRLVQSIDYEKTRKSGLSEYHDTFKSHISTGELADIIHQYHSLFENTRHALVSLRNLEYQLLARLAVLPDYHYDEARKIVCELASEIGKKEDHQVYLIAEKIECLLLSELKAILKQYYEDELDVSVALIDEHVDNIHKMNDIFVELDKLTIFSPQLDYSEKKIKIQGLVRNWQEKIELVVNDWFLFHRNWTDKKETEQITLFADEHLRKLAQAMPKDEIYYYLSRLVPRLLNFPHLKDLDKPTIILVAGTSGVGKSTLSQYISKTLGISTYFSTDVTSRSVMRNAFAFIFGDDSNNIFPALYGSSFDEDSLQWYYNQSLLSMIGTTGSIDRLVKENVSAVIDGVSLIPGTLDEKYFEIANIVWVVACIKDEAIHYQRMDTRDETGVSRGGADRYKQKMSVIRNNHDRMLSMGEKASCFIADNSATLSQTLDRTLRHIKTPYSDRGLPITDSIRDEVHDALKEKVASLFN